MKTEFRSRLTVFILSFLVWLALTAGGGIQEVLAGLAAALLVAWISGRFLLVNPGLRGTVRRLGYAVAYFLRFLWEMVKANLHVASIVLDPWRPIKPGIVKIKTGLSRDTAMTVLANSITLTPGTFTIDINPEKKELYIHCITVESTDIETNSRTIGGKFEKLLKEVLE